VANYLTELAAAIRARVGECAVPPGDADALFRVYAALALAKGDRVDGKDVHNAWVAWISAADPNHESAVPYEQLSAATRKQDEPFVLAIRAVVLGD
jgi:hypothetical protein